MYFPISIYIITSFEDCCTRDWYQGQGQLITPTVSVGCNYLSLPLTPASVTSPHLLVSQWSWHNKLTHHSNLCKQFINQTYDVWHHQTIINSFQHCDAVAPDYIHLFHTSEWILQDIRNNSNPWRYLFSLSDYINSRSAARSHETSSIIFMDKQSYPL